MANQPTRVERVSVIGSGSWGTALAQRIAMKGYRVQMWSRRQELVDEITETRRNSRYTKEYELHENIQLTTDLKSAAKAHVIVMVVPSKGFREISRKIGDFLEPDQIVLSATKGIEPHTYLRMTQIIKEETPCLKVGAISGPNLALEVMADHPTATIVASRFDEVVEAGLRVLNYGRFRAYGSHDLIGVELAGALKNILAIASGMITGLGFEANTRGFLLSRGLSEIMRLGQHCGVDPLTISGIAGVGDIIVTCGSEKSRNFSVGKRIGQGQKISDILGSMHQVAEGVRTAEAAYELGEKYKEDLPIFKTVYQILYEGLSIEAAMLQLLDRPMHYEHEMKRQISDRLH